MSEQFSFFAIAIKFLALIGGGIFCLVMSGDVNSDGHIKINRNVALKFFCSVVIGLYCGEFLIDYLDWEHLNIFSQGFVLMSFSVFGMAIFGALYRSFQLTFTDKTLSEIIQEVKQAVTAILK